MIGIPIIYQGQEQQYGGGAPPASREALWFSGYSTTSEFYTWIAKLNQIRSWAVAQDGGYVTSTSSVIFSDSRSIATRKGSSGSQVVAVFTNGGSSSSVTVSLSSSATGFEASQPLVDVMSCTIYTTDAGGGLTLTLNSGLPKVLYPRSRLSNSGICSDLTGTTATTATLTTLTTITTSSTAGTTSSTTTTSSTPITSSTAASSSVTASSSTVAECSITVGTTTTGTTTKTTSSTTAGSTATTSTGEYPEQNAYNGGLEPRNTDKTGPASSATCTLAAVSITFNELVTTAYGDTVVV